MNPAVRVASIATVALVACRCASSVPVPKPAGPPLEVKKGAFPHETFDGVLKRVVNENGRVDYKALEADRTELERYLAALASTSPHQDPDLFPRREDKLAYWINSYNAWVMYAVTERPAMKSVDDEKLSFFVGSKYQLGNEALSLYSLENDVVRKEFNEPRVHFALNCASGGCPELPNEAFMPDKLEEQLTREAREFCANDAKVRVKDGKVQASKIFDWYGDDFKADGGVVGFCKKYGRDLPAGDVEFIDYDWKLNAQPGKALFEP